MCPLAVRAMLQFASYFNFHQFKTLKCNTQLVLTFFFFDSKILTLGGRGATSRQHFCTIWTYLVIFSYLIVQLFLCLLPHFQRKLLFSYKYNV